MNRHQAFSCLAVIALAATSAAAQEANFAASTIANDNGTTTIIMGPGGGAATFTVTGMVQLGDNAAATVKATYLGVATSFPPEPLADQLKLAKGVGLLVEFIDAKGPAAAAGLRKNDVLTRLDDQLLT